jgi:uncharacterized protein YecE (DUF72 family)
MIADLFGLPDEPADPSSSDQTGQAAAISGARKRAHRQVQPAPMPPELAALSGQLPAHLRLGTSSWSYPGWDGLVYGGDYSTSTLAKHGLLAYAAHPLLHSVSLDRSFYAPLTLADYLAYAAQTPEHFRFIVKAPSSVTDAVLRDERGTPERPNPCFLNVEIALREFVTPCIEGLGTRAGALVFQFSPLPQHWLAASVDWIAQVGNFFAALPPLPQGCWYALEIRDAALLTPRLIKMLQATGVRYCLAVHARMPDVVRQASALALLDAHAAGPLIVRWSLHSGFKYEQAKAKYHPFNAVVDADPATRTALAQLAAHYALAGQQVMITISNKAEGCAPLTCFALAGEIIQALGHAQVPATALTG